MTFDGHLWSSFYSNVGWTNFFGVDQRDQFGADEDAQKDWFTHWVTLTFDALEVALAEGPKTGRFCHGDDPTIADLCLYAQVWNNRRFGIPLETWPTIVRIFGVLDALHAFRDAAPLNQPDAA